MRAVAVGLYHEMNVIRLHGEVQTLRDALARSGRSVEQWSERYRKNYALAAATAEAATSPPPSEP